MVEVKKIIKRTMVALLVVFMALPSTVMVKAQEPSNENLALNKKVVASKEYSTMPASNLTDANEKSRWSTEAGPTQWAYVDLGVVTQMDYFSMIWESDENQPSSFNIYVSNDTENWGNPVVSITDNKASTTEIELENPASGRYVKLEITKVNGYPNVSCSDFKIKYLSGAISQNPEENVALNKSAVSSSKETDGLNASKATDGNTTSKDSRWASAVSSAVQWIYVDLGQTSNVKTVQLYWETRKATNYEVQVSNSISSPTQDSDWKTVYASEERPKQKLDIISLDTVEKARYVRLKINKFTAEDPDGGVTWNTISIYEMEVYGGTPKESIDEIGNKIQVVTPKLGAKVLEVEYPQTEQFEITYNGTDFEQVVDRDLTIYTPIVDKKVVVSFKLVDKKTKEYAFAEKEVVIPGTYQKESTDNKALTVLPELQEWKGHSGTFKPTSSSRIVVGNAGLLDVANAFAKDYAEITGNSIKVVEAAQPSKGDFFLTLTSDKSLGLKEEGYLMTIDEDVSVIAEHERGAFWSTRTILHSLKSDKSLAKGIARDYPLYELRGFILDVGRKTFTLDYLQQVVKEMSWYKLNDFQVHLNDNLIPLENYSAKGLDPMTAYSGFRLESDIKEGGNNGLNKADLTSKDVFYTKEGFANFIKESRVYGVDIVPEIDTPAHSLALTKVRPDLRHGTYGRDNDHLNLTGKYDESISFVKDIFNEYMGKDLTNPVFDKDTIIHVGADEYNANHEAYRRFADDMLKYVQDNNRTARIWGSLSASKGTTPVRSEGVQMNLWNFGYANMDKMYEEGFDLINCNDGTYYIVPNAGYYYDYLNNNVVYNQKINSIGGVTIPAGDKQMIGGAFAVWNDMTDYLDNGVSEFDVFDRIERVIPLFGAKLWGKDTLNQEEANQLSKDLGNAPQTNFKYKVETTNDKIAHYPLDSSADTSGNERDIKDYSNSAIVSVDGKNALELEGDSSYATTPLTTAGLGNDLRVKVKRTSYSTDEQILFESNYGSIKAVQKETGQVGVTRENYDYSFNYTLPVNEWVELEFKNEFKVISLYVNGKLVDTLGDGERVEGKPLLATNMLPLARIGSTTNAFIGYIDDVRVGVNDDFASTMKLDYAIGEAVEVLKLAPNADLSKAIEKGKSLLLQYKPSQTDIDTLEAQIRDLLNKTDYEKANYKNIDIYKSLTNRDKSIFTKESVENLERAFANVREGLPKSQQYIVDGYENDIVTALDKLELNDSSNINFVNRAKLTATASSFQANDSKPELVLDDNPSTIWHSKWSITTMPHWIQLETDEPTSVKGLTYLPRQSGANGNATSYQIQISDDGQNFTKVKEGTLESNAQEKVIEFDKVTTKFVRLVYVKAVNNNGSAAEIKLISGDVAPDIQGLESIIEDAESVVNEGFTDTTWTTFQESIEKAKKVLLDDHDTLDANDIENLKIEVQNNIFALRLEKKLDISRLVELVERAESLDLDLYTTSTVNNLKEAISKAKAIIGRLRRRSITAVNVDEAYNNLVKAINDLELKGNTEKLDALVDELSKLDPKDYTKDSMANLVNAIQAANDFDRNDANQDAVDTMYDSLIAAKEQLVLEVKTEDLDSLIKDFEDLKPNQYTKESFDELVKVIEEAKLLLLNDPTQDEIDAMTAKVKDAFESLVEVEVIEPELPGTGISPTWPNYLLIGMGIFVLVLNKRKKELE